MIKASFIIFSPVTADLWYEIQNGGREINILLFFRQCSLLICDNKLITKETHSAGVQAFYLNTLATRGLACSMAKG